MPMLFVIAASLQALISGPISQADRARAPTYTPSVSLRISARPLSEIAAMLTDQTGASVSVEDRIAGWKATIAYKGPLEPLLESLCRNFRLRNERTEVQSGTERGTWAYRLKLDEDEAERLDALVAAQARQAAALARQDAEQMMKTLLHLLNHPERRVRMTEEGPLSPLVKDAEPILDLLGSMDSGFMQRVVSSRRYSIPEYDKSPSATVPVADMSPVQRSLVRSYLESVLSRLRSDGQTETTYYGNMQTAMEQLDRSRIGFWILNNGMGQMLHMSVFTPGQLWSPDFPVVYAETAAVPSRPQSDGSSTSEDPPDLKPDASTDLILDDLDYAEAALKMAETCGVYLVADAFCLPARAKGRWIKKPRAIVLNEFGRQLQVERRWHGDVLLLRAEGWERLLQEEPPASVLDALGQALDEAGSVTLDEMANAAAAMRREHTAGLCRWRSPKGASGAPVANALGTRFAVWKWLGKLRPSQRRSVTGSGLRVRDLSPYERGSLQALAASTGVPVPSDRAVLRCSVGRTSPPRVLLCWQEPGTDAVSEVR